MRDKKYKTELEQEVSTEFTCVYDKKRNKYLIETDANGYEAFMEFLEGVAIEIEDLPLENNSYGKH